MGVTRGGAGREEQAPAAVGCLLSRARPSDVTSVPARARAMSHLGVSAAARAGVMSHLGVSAAARAGAMSHLGFSAAARARVMSHLLWSPRPRPGALGGAGARAQPAPGCIWGYWRPIVGTLRRVGARSHSEGINRSLQGVAPDSWHIEEGWRRVPCHIGSPARPILNMEPKRRVTFSCPGPPLAKAACHIKLSWRPRLNMDPRPVRHTSSLARASTRIRFGAPVPPHDPSPALRPSSGMCLARCCASQKSLQIRKFSVFSHQKGRML